MALDSGVDGCRIKGKTAETADAEDADAVFVNFVMCGADSLPLRKSLPC